MRIGGFLTQPRRLLFRYCAVIVAPGAFLLNYGMAMYITYPMAGEDDPDVDKATQFNTFMSSVQASAARAPSPSSWGTPLLKQRTGTRLHDGGALLASTCPLCGKICSARA